MTRQILHILQTRCGVDLTGYRAATLERRIRNRMLVAGAATVDDYERLLERSDVEAALLLERVAIKVSRFYRNAAVFDALRGILLPALARRHAELHFWSAGCARGEEAYTLAMLLEEAGIPGDVLATDVEPGALEAAAGATYAAAALKELPLALRTRFLEPVGSSWRVTPRVRARVRFAAHDLVNAAAPKPEAGFHLVACRNVLIYWTRSVQQRILDSLLQATAADGLLMLGESEWPMPSAAQELRETRRGDRIFERVRAPGAEAIA